MDRPRVHSEEEPTPPPYYGKAYTSPQTMPLLSPEQTPDKNTTVVAIETHPDNQPEPYDSCHLGWSVVSFCLCSLLGIIAVTLSLLGYTDHRTGNYKGYVKKRKCAIGFLVIGIILGLLIVGAYVTCKIFHGEEGGYERMWSSISRVKNT